MRKFYIYTMALFGLFPFVSCKSVRNNDHSYMYVYQHLTQPQVPAKNAVRECPSSPRERPSLALEADPEPAGAGESERVYTGAQERVYGAVPVREYAPVQNVAYAPSGPGALLCSAAERLLSDAAAAERTARLQRSVHGPRQFRSVFQERNVWRIGGQLPAARKHGREFHLLFWTDCVSLGTWELWQRTLKHLPGKNTWSY